MAEEREWNARRMFELYVHDYMVKKKMHGSAEIFRREANITDHRVGIDSEEGFLHEWWSVFSTIHADRQRLSEEAHRAEGSLEIGESKQGCNNRAVEPPVAPTPQVPIQIPRSTRFDDILEKPAAISAEMLPLSQPSMENLLSFGQFGLDEADFSFPILSPSSSMPPRMMEQLKHGNQMNSSRSASNDLSAYLSYALPTPRSRDYGTSDRLNLRPLSGWPRNVSRNAPNDQQQNQIFRVDHEQRHFSRIKQSADYSISKSNPMLTKIGTQENNDPIAAFLTMEHQSQNVQLQRPPLRNGRKKMGPSNLKPVKTPKVVAKVDDGNSTVKTVNSISTQDGAENKQHDINLEEIHCIRSSKNPLSCCDFSLDGKFLACAGSEGKVFVWNTDACYSASPAVQHSLSITDVRFRPNSSIFVTSSLDRTLKIWDAADPHKTHPQRYGHAGPVMSLDFHPRKADLLCSCDSNDKIRLWNFANFKNIRTFKIKSPDVQLGATRQVRFQPGYETLIATASGNVIKVFDAETSDLLLTLKGHIKDILSITWDVSGACILSVSEESARIWSILSTKCVHELRAGEKKFESGTFHPKDQSLGIIGGYKSMEIWDPIKGGGTMSISAHEGTVTALAQAGQPAMLASASNDCSVKLWK